MKWIFIGWLAVCSFLLSDRIDRLESKLSDSTLNDNSANIKLLWLRVDKLEQQVYHLRHSK